MKPNDFVYKQIYQGAMKLGAMERIAKEHAQMGAADYAKNRFEKATAMIENRIKMAKRESEKESDRAFAQPHRGH